MKPVVQYTPGTRHCAVWPTPSQCEDMDLFVNLVSRVREEEQRKLMIEANKRQKDNARRQADRVRKRRRNLIASMLDTAVICFSVIGIIVSFCFIIA